MMQSYGAQCGTVSLQREQFKIYVVLILLLVSPDGRLFIRVAVNYIWEPAVYRCVMLCMQTNFVLSLL
jgi:hypothetical protein